MKRIYITLAVLLVFGLRQTQGAIVTSLFNTGVDGAGNDRPDGTLGDFHYLLTSVPGGSSVIRIIDASSATPSWIGDDSLSRWIGPNNGSMLDGPVGNYVYRTTFDLTGFDPSTAKIVGQWSTDNNATDMLINGNSTGNGTPGLAFLFWTPFTISSGFGPGINTLDFLIFNGGGPTGLRVEMIGTANATTDGVPEPTAFLVWAGLGLASLGFVALQKRRGLV